MGRMKVYAFFMLLCFCLWLGASAEPPEFGEDADGKLCPDGGLCCSSDDALCAITEPYSQRRPPPPRRSPPPPPRRSPPPPPRRSPPPPPRRSPPPPPRRSPPPPPRRSPPPPPRRSPPPPPRRSPPPPPLRSPPPPPWRSPPPPPPTPRPSPPPPPGPSPPSPPGPSPPEEKDVTDIISPEIFEEMLMNRNHPFCEGSGFYSYDAFVLAARYFDGFGTTGDETIRRRELAAFFGQTSHQTAAPWDYILPDARYTWGYCLIREVGPHHDYCIHDPQWPCVPGESYYGRGPIQLTNNINYGQAGEAIGIDLLGHADLVAIDSVISFQTAIWFWMTPQRTKPSSHDVIVNNWQPSHHDLSVGRFPGYGVITNIINGAQECGFHHPNSKVESRIAFYKRYCDILDVDYGDNLDCYFQRPFDFDSGVKLSDKM